MQLEARHLHRQHVVRRVGQHGVQDREPDVARRDRELAGLAITTRTELLIIILGGLFVTITLSVIIQVGSFKMTGKRVFRMAPLQHHFELLGWNEVTIVIRFWIIAGLFVAGGLGVFYAEWVSAA